MNRPGASGSVHTRWFRRSRTPTVCPGGYHGGYRESLRRADARSAHLAAAGRPVD